MRRRHLWSSTVLLVFAAGCAEGPSTPLAPSGSSTARARVTGDRTSDAHELVAKGDDHFSVPPDVFGTTTPIIAHFRFDARKSSGGGVSGSYYVVEAYDGATYHYRGTFTCFGVYDFNGLTGNRAKIGGIVTESDDPTSPVGTYLWWQAIDNDHTVPRMADQSTLVGGGDNAANEAFCSSDNPPRFGPFAIDGRIEVRPEEGD
jgi:hypothetical protein